MKKYPKIGIRPTIDGRQGGVRESLEEKTMNLAKAVAELISNNLKNGDGSPVECVIADSTIRKLFGDLTVQNVRELYTLLPYLPDTHKKAFPHSVSTDATFKIWTTTQSLKMYRKRFFALHVLHRQ